MTDLAHDLNHLMNNVRIRCVGVLDDAIKLELFNVLKEFFDISSVWTEEVEIDVEAGETTYETLVPHEQGDIIRLKQVVNSDEIQVEASMATPTTLELRNEPNVDDTYTATVIKTVSYPRTRDGYPEFPDWILARYGMAILDGVLGRLMMHYAKPYSNERHAVYHNRRFRDGCAIARADALHLNLQGAQAWSFPQGFAV